MSTRTKLFILLLTPFLAFLLPTYLIAFSRPWRQVLPAPPVNTVMIVGTGEGLFPSPTIVRTKDGKYYRLADQSTNNKKWMLVKNVVNERAKPNLMAGQDKFTNPLIPFLFNPPPGTVIDHFYTEHTVVESTWPRYTVYYVLLDNGTLWSWSAPYTLDNHNALNRLRVIYVVIVFVVTGGILLVMNPDGRSLPFRKPHLLFLVFISLFIGCFIITCLIPFNALYD